MPLNEIVQREMASCKPSDSVFDVAQIMKDKAVGAVVVLESRKPVGILTDRDLVLRCLTQPMDLSLTTAEEVMSPAVETVLATAGIYDVTKKMKQAWVRRVVIVDEAGDAVAVLSFDDVFDLIAEEITNLKEVIKPLVPKFVDQAA